MDLLSGKRHILSPLLASLPSHIPQASTNSNIIFIPTDQLSDDTTPAASNKDSGRDHSQ